MANPKNAAKIKSSTLSTLDDQNNFINRQRKADKKCHGLGERKSSSSSMLKNKEVLKVMTDHARITEKFILLQKHNEKLVQDLLEEKQRCENYQTKFKYLKGNHAVFQRIKENYLSAKTNELTAKEVIKVEEQESQTENITCTDNIFTRYENYDYGSNYTSDSSEAYIPVEPGYTAVKIKEFNAIKKTIKTLKQCIVSQPLSTFVISEESEAKYRKDIATLFEENRSLKQLVIDKQLELAKARKGMISDSEIQKECNMLMKIVAKLKMQIYKLEEPDSVPTKNIISAPTDRENGIIEHITEKYNIKYTLKNKSRMKSPTKIKKPKIPTPFLTPRTNNVASDVESDDAESACSTFRSCDEDGERTDMTDIDSNHSILKYVASETSTND